MARFNLALLFVVVAAWSVNVAQSVPLPRAPAEAGTIISMSSGNGGTSNKDMNGTTSASVMMSSTTIASGSSSSMMMATPTSTSTSFTSTATTTTSTNTNATTIKTDSLQCNIARATVFTDLDETFALLQQVDTSTNKTLANAINSANNGLVIAALGVKDFLTALVNGQDAPPDVNDRIGKGVKDILGALSGLNSTDPKVMSALRKAQDALAAGNEVVAVCR